jgi:hypothetical protein
MLRHGGDTKESRFIATVSELTASTPRLPTPDMSRAISPVQQLVLVLGCYRIVIVSIVIRSYNRGTPP